MMICNRLLKAKSKSCWHDATELPPKVGYYLLIQEHIEIFFWVRFWDGSEWLNLKKEIYGPITYWMELPEYPS